MRKLTIVMTLALVLGFMVSAQATETELSVFQIVNNMLVGQGITPISEENFNASLVTTYETFAPGPYTITYYGKQAGLNQQAYAYAVGDPGNSIANLGAYSQNSNGTNLQGKLATPVSFSPDVAWGLKGTAGDNTFYSQSSLNTADDGKVHWKLYCLNPLGYDIGFAAYEDLPNNDYDFNDLVLKIEPNPPAAPIPGSLLLLGSGILGLVGMRTQRKFS